MIWYERERERESSLEIYLIMIIYEKIVFFISWREDFLNE
jgi:hypothetical protein